MSKLIQHFLLITCLINAGCGTARMIVTEPPEERYSAETISVQKGTNTVSVPDDIVSYFDKELRENLSENFPKGSDLTLEYRFISFDSGDRMKRYLGGGIGNWGEGALIIEVRFYDSNHKQIAKVQTDGKIDSGMFGGSIKSAIEQAAEELSDYTASNFRK